MENSHLRFLAPPHLWGPSNICRSSWAHWKARSGLPISDNRTLSLGLTAEALWEKINLKLAFLKEWGQFGPKFQVQGVVPHQPFFLSESSMNAPFIWYKNFGSGLFCFVTKHTFDRRTERRTHRKATAITCVCIRSRKVKKIMGGEGITPSTGEGNPLPRLHYLASQQLPPHFKTWICLWHWIDKWDYTYIN